MLGQCQSYAARAGAQVQYPRLGHALQPGQRLLHQHLGVRAGDQHALGDVQRQAVKLPFADEVRHRLARQMTLGQPLHLLLHGSRDVQPAVPAQLLPALAGGAAHQLPGLQRGVSHAGFMEALPQIQIQIVICYRHNTSCYRFLP